MFNIWWIKAFFAADSSFDCQHSDEPRSSNEITERTENFEIGKKLSRGFTIKNILKSESHNDNPLTDDYSDKCQSRNLDNSIMRESIKLIRPELSARHPDTHHSHQNKTGRKLFAG